MKKLFALAVFIFVFTVFTLAIFAEAWSQEVVITGFPIGKGMEVLRTDFLKPYYPIFQNIADTLETDPSAEVEIVAMSDGNEYREYNDPLNAALAFSRVNAIIAVLVDKFHIDLNRVTRIKARQVEKRGPQYRLAAVRIVRKERGVSEIEKEIEILSDRIDSIVNCPPSPTFIRPVANYFLENKTGWGIGFGVSTAEIGTNNGDRITQGVGVPIIKALLCYDKTIYLSAEAGHSLIGRTRAVNGRNEKTYSQLIGVHLVIYPCKKSPIGFVVGGIQHENITKKAEKTLRFSRGAEAGISGRFKYFSVWVIGDFGYEWRYGLGDKLGFNSVRLEFSASKIFGMK